MNEKQNEHFSGDSNKNQQYELEVTITPTNYTHNLSQENRPPETLNNYSQQNMAANIQYQQNTPKPLNNNNSIQNQQTSVNNSNYNNLKALFENNPQLSSIIKNPSFFSMIKSFQESISASQNNQNSTKPFLPTAKSISQTQSTQNSKNNDATTPNPPVKALSQPPLSAYQATPSLNITQGVNQNISKPYTPPQQVNFSANVQPNYYNPNCTINGYRINSNNVVEYQINSSSEPSSFSYCPSTQITNFEAIRRFWLKNNGYDEKTPRKPINKPKKKKKRFLDYSSNSPSPTGSPSLSSLSSNTDEKPKNDSNSSKISKALIANLPPLLSIDKEPNVEILGIVQRNPIIKIAIRREGSNNVEIIPTAEARKSFPMQLSKFYEQFITFTDYE